MKFSFCFISFAFCVAARAQSMDNSLLPETSMLRDLLVGDSIVYYQCHVEDAIQQLTTASGQTLTGKQQKYSITEKYVLIKEEKGYMINYYASSLNVFPNKKFSGLKIRERPYWAFKKDKSFKLKEDDLRVFLSLEKKGREAIEYDFAISRYTTNQLIIKHKKNFKQLVIEGNYVISKLISMN
jgi:hypothetical protein